MIYRVRSEDNAWLWEMVAYNGRTVARSTSTFTTEEGATRSARRTAQEHGAYFYIDRVQRGMATVEAVKPVTS